MASACSAEARAKKEGRPVDEILAEMAGETRAVGMLVLLAAEDIPLAEVIIHRSADAIVGECRESDASIWVKRALRLKQTFEPGCFELIELDLEPATADIDDVALGQPQIFCNRLVGPQSNRKSCLYPIQYPSVGIVKNHEIQTSLFLYASKPGFNHLTSD